MMMVPLEELLARADYITLHIPLTESSLHMIDAEINFVAPDAYPILELGEIP